MHCCFRGDWVDRRWPGKGDHEVDDEKIVGCWQALFYSGSMPCSRGTLSSSFKTGFILVIEAIYGNSDFLAGGHVVW